MAGPTPPSRTRASAGLSWAVGGLAGFLVLQLATAAGLVLMIQLYGLPSPSVVQVLELENALLLLSWLLLILGVASGLVYCVGLAGLYATRHLFGAEHARSVEQTLPWLAVTLVLLATVVVVPSLTGPFLTFPGVGYPPPDWAGSVGVVLAGLRAIFAGLGTSAISVGLFIAVYREIRRDLPPSAAA